jgi:hypothetical protein
MRTKPDTGRIVNQGNPYYGLQPRLKSGSPASAWSMTIPGFPMQTDHCFESLDCQRPSRGARTQLTKPGLPEAFARRAHPGLT